MSLSMAGLEAYLFEEEAANRTTAASSAADEASAAAAASAELDAALQRLALPPLQLAQRAKDNASATTLVDGVQAVLRLYRDNRSRHDDLENRLYRAQDTAAQLEAARDRLKSELEAEVRKTAQVEELRRREALRLKELENENRAAKEELRKAKANMAAQLKQSEHEKRRLEKTSEALKAKLLAGVAAAESAQPGASHWLNDDDKLPRAEGRRQWNVGVTGVKELTSKVSEQYQERQQELERENTAMRKTLASLEAALMALLNRGDASATPANPSAVLDDSRQGVEPIDGGHYVLPLSVSGSRIESSLMAKIQTAQRQMDQLLAGGGLPAAPAAAVQPAQTQPAPTAAESALAKNLDARAAEVAKKEDELKTMEVRLQRDREALNKVAVDIRRQQAKLDRERQAVAAPRPPPSSSAATTTTIAATSTAAAKRMQELTALAAAAAAEDEAENAAATENAPTQAFVVGGKVYAPIAGADTLSLSFDGRI